MVAPPHNSDSVPLKSRVKYVAVVMLVSFLVILTLAFNFKHHPGVPPAPITEASDEKFDSFGVY
jgi:hypothetical protein